ncbi:FAD/NAD(P)-binding domain-containing protein [Dendrothele bispora CBS 962.96]|uniref:FAD/NAD(P)-binding domain-containing protein n=1 Tax=Dendrothele bispora (strain CBS 962.96) TaxID=1314807 RepID=A0A4S8M9K4_DENBC|nr:FAD/NAD(P)-binding domain-containing protein [Dendrothele bispora CBS 962.96]
MFDSTQAKKFRIAIIGGGVSGLTCACVLRHSKNVEIDVYEAAEEIAEVGAGVTVWPRTWKLLKSMGIEQDMVDVLKERPTDEPKLAFTFRKSDQKQGITFKRMISHGGVATFHRADVQQALLKNSPPFCKIHLSHRLSHYLEEDNSVKLFFLNGSTATCDLLIGADGIKSIVRQHLHAQPNNGITYTGTVAFRGLIPVENLPTTYNDSRQRDDPVIYCGDSKYIVRYPVSKGRLINVGAFCTRLSDVGKTFEGPTVREATQEELLEEFKGWEDEVINLLKCIEKPTCWAIQDIKPLKSYVSERVVVIGDAAHAMSPHFGIGAGQAMEDAYVLGGLLCKLTSDEEISSFLKIYDDIRRPFANRVLQNSRQQGLFYQFNMPGFRDLVGDTSPEHLATLGDILTRRWAFAWNETVENDRNKAISMLGSKYKL